jgi:hypothetical protein
MREIVFYIVFNFHPYQIGKRYTFRVYPAHWISQPIFGINYFGRMLPSATDHAQGMIRICCYLDDLTIGEF